MMVSRPVCRITCQVPRLLSSRVRSALEGTDPISGFVQPGRIVQLRERRRRPSLEETLCDIYRLYFPSEMEAGILERIIAAAGLEMASRGSIFSEEVELMLPAPAGETPGVRGEPEEVAPLRRFPLVTDLMGIRCILPRGLGNAVAQLALELGTCVPAVTFGRGTGLRDRLGLLRIAIPADKELVTLVVPRHDAQGLARRLVEGGRLDQPGRGFMYLYPIGRGLLNIRVRIGAQRHAASIDQLVAAVDALWSGTGWRRRFPAEERSAVRRTVRFQHDLLEMSLVCRAECADELTRAAVQAGAGGATSERVVRIGDTESAARELTTLVVPARRRDRILDALEGAGLFEEETAGGLYICPSPLSYSYARRAAARP